MRNTDMDPYVLETFQLFVIKNCGFSSYSSHRLVTKKLHPITVIFYHVELYWTGKARIVYKIAVPELDSGNFVIFI